MKRRVVVVLLLVLFGLGLGFISYSGCRASRPVVYQGMPLRAWFSQLSTANPQARADAAAAIRAMGSNACPELISLLRTHDAWWRREIWSRGAKLPSETRDSVLANVHEPDAFLIREAAARSLASLGPAARPAIPALVEAVRDTQGQVAVEAADALGRIGGNTAVPALVRNLKNWNGRIRLNALYALAQLGSEAKAAIPAVIPLLADEQARFPAAYALARMAADGTLLETTRRGDEKSRAAAARGLGIMVALRRDLPTETVVRALAAALSDNSIEVRVEAAQSLRLLGSDASPAVSALSECLNEQSALLREAAASALGAVGSSAAAALPNLQRLENDPQIPVRLAAVKALASIQGR